MVPRSTSRFVLAEHPSQLHGKVRKVFPHFQEKLTRVGSRSPGYTISCSFRAAGLAFRPVTTGNKDRRLHYQEISEWFVKSSSVTRTKESQTLGNDFNQDYNINKR